MNEYTWIVHPYDGYDSDNFQTKIMAESEDASHDIIIDKELGYPQVCINIEME